MADQSLYSPINPHFFQPLLPGFHTHLNIPVTFFSKHVERRSDHIEFAKLRSDASDKTWLVKMDGLKFTDGWEDFAVAHDLRIGDITVFRDEGEMAFHVTALGPSCCEVQYTSTSSHNINDDSHDHTNNNVTGSSSREKIKKVKKNPRKKVKKNPRKTVKKNPRKKVESSSHHSRFVTKVSPSSLKLDRLYLPLSFARSNGLQKMSGKKIILLNEKGESWNSYLDHKKASKQTYIKPGWRRFCRENGMNQGHYTFKLVRKSGTPVIRLFRAEHSPKSDPESSLHHSCYEGSVTSSSLKTNKLYLRREFVTANGLDKGNSQIVLQNEQGIIWTLALRHYKSLKHTSIGPGWKTFCQENGIEAGDPFVFKLVGTGEKPVLSLCPSNPEKTPLKCPEDCNDVNFLSSRTNKGDDNSKFQESEEKKKNLSRCRASSSYSQDHFVTLTLTAHAVNQYKLILPVNFTRVNGIHKPGKITLLGQDGVKQVVDLFQNKRTGAMRIGKGWREFCKAHGVEIYESFVLEIIWEEEASPVLKFCTKVNSV